MANSVTTQILEDGARHTVVKFDGALDTSDMALTTILDPANQFIDPANPTTQYRIDRLLWSISDPLALRLWWDATTDVRILDLEGRGDFPGLGHCYGGLQNNSGAGKTGKILGQTTGYTSGTLCFTLIMNCTKQ